MNMKRIWSLALACLILLSGCMAAKPQDATQPQATTRSLQENSTEPPAAETVVTEPLPTEPPPTEPPLPPTDTTPPEELGMTATNAFVYDTGISHMVYLGGDGDAQLAMASLTKLMTAYTARQIMEPEYIITVGSEVEWIDPLSSRAWVANGHQLTMEMLIEAMMLPSGNDAAYAIAVGGGRVLAEDPELDKEMALNVFLDEMNAQARALGMKNSHFANPDGIDEEGHYTTVNDLAVLSLAVLQDEIIMKYAGMAEDDVVFASGEIITWKNSNYLLHPDMEEYYTPEAVGLKTGSTEEAGRCLISVFQREDGSFLIVGILGCTEEDPVRYDETLILYEMYR